VGGAGFCSQTRPPTAELPHGYVAWALTALFLRSSGHFNTDLARRTGVLVRRLPLDWNNRIIFVSDSKTAEGRRMIPMSDRVCEVLRARDRVEEAKDGCFHPSDRTAAT
jgi:hypothetical protein